MTIRKTAIKLIWKKVVDVFWTILRTFGELWQVVICYSYTMIWESKEQTRQWLTASARVVLLGSSLLFLIEIGSNIFDEHLFHIKLPWYVKVIVIMLAAWMVWHRWKEMRSHQRAIIFTKRMAELFRELSAVNLVAGNEGTRRANLAKYIDIILGGFADVFEKKNLLEMSIMTLDAGLLTITYYHPPTASYDIQKFKLKEGEGGAGQAINKQVAIYFPAIKYKEGIIIPPSGKGYDVALSYYVPSPPDPFKSILSIPIPTTQAGKRVLTIDSKRQNAFSQLDFHIGYVAASVLGLAFDTYEQVP
jgi:hypothetical protein